MAFDDHCDVGLLGTPTGWVRDSLASTWYPSGLGDARLALYGCMGYYREVLKSCVRFWGRERFFTAVPSFPGISLEIPE